MRKALVIGSEGNIGTPLVKHLRAAGYDVVESDIRPAWRPGYVMADINYPVDLLPAFDAKPDVVFLLSAMVSRVTCEQASSLAIATNLAGVNNVLQLAKRAGASVRARNGYWAPSPDEAMRAAILAEINSPKPAPPMREWPRAITSGRSC